MAKQFTVYHGAGRRDKAELSPSTRPDGAELMGIATNPSSLRWLADDFPALSGVYVSYVWGVRSHGQLVALWLEGRNQTHKVNYYRKIENGHYNQLI